VRSGSQLVSSPSAADFVFQLVLTEGAPRQAHRSQYSEVNLFTVATLPRLAALGLVRNLRGNLTCRFSRWGLNDCLIIHPSCRYGNVAGTEKSPPLHCLICFTDIRVQYSCAIWKHCDTFSSKLWLGCCRSRVLRTSTSSLFHIS